MDNFLEGRLGKLPTPVFRLGLSATYRPGKRTVYEAADQGLNYYFFFGFDTHMTEALREILHGERERYVVGAGAYNYIWGHQNLRHAVEKRLQQLRTDYIDVFHFLGVTKASQFTAKVQDELLALRNAGLVRMISVSTHDRKFAGQMAAHGVLDSLMIRYNAAHRGAEQDIFPHLAAHAPGVVSFTATRWRYLLRRPSGWANHRIPTAGMCYRFVLSNPHVDICMTAPTNIKQFRDNLAEVRRGPLDPEEAQFMRAFGDAVYRQQHWFM